MVRSRSVTSFFPIAMFFMVKSEEPALRPSLAKEVGPDIPLVQASRKHLPDAAGAALLNKIIHLPADAAQHDL